MMLTALKEPTIAPIAALAFQDVCEDCAEQLSCFSGHLMTACRVSIKYSVIVALTDLPIGYSVIVALTDLPIGYSVIVALTGLPIGYSVIVALTGLPIGYSVIVALTGLPIGYSVIVALTGLPIGYNVIVTLTGLHIFSLQEALSNTSLQKRECTRLIAAICSIICTLPSEQLSEHLNSLAGSRVERLEQLAQQQVLQTWHTM